MLRPLLALGAAALVAGTATAATYSAKPAGPSPSAKYVGRDIVWKCGPGVCVGATSTSRPLVICQGLAKQAGRLESFAVDGRPLPAAELERCNAFARSSSDPALANAR